MSSLSAKCGGGGWTLVMKLDGDKVKNLTNSIDMPWILSESIDFPDILKVRTCAMSTYEKS